MQKEESSNARELSFNSDQILTNKKKIHFFSTRFNLLEISVS